MIDKQDFDELKFLSSEWFNTTMTGIILQYLPEKLLSIVSNQITNKVWYNRDPQQTLLTEITKIVYEKI